ncbi:MAG TPA: ATP-dependent DNA helicase RecG [Egibacteraceae bacterium]|nr:ATP-dependent DNA helicase RecG [Egibacteraceae bacterium]
MDARAWLDAEIAAVPGVSPRLAGALGRSLDLHTVRDLLEHYPHQGKYRDIGEQVPVAQAPLGEPVTIVGTIGSWNIVRPRGRRMTIAKAKVVDDAGGRVEVSFFNQEWMPKRLPAGSRVAASGTLEQFKSTLQLRNAKVVVLGEGETVDDTDRIQPTYPATEKVPSSTIAEVVRAALDALPPLPEHLPEDLRQDRDLLDYDTALRRIHRPADLADVPQARRRLVYDELLTLQVGLQQRRRRLESEAVGLAQAPPPDGVAARFVEVLPFRPTGAQSKAFEEIAADLAAPKPMHRLLQGDVGAGKTLVAAWAMLAALDAGRQAVLMAPTEVLAEQHLRTFTALLSPLGVNAPGGPRLELLTGATSTTRRRGLLAQLVSGDIDLLVGTHALLEEQVAFHDLGVVVIDEQHRFGVEHRTRLRDKRSDGRSPDVLVMTATPIPRSLALTLYGDLDVTVLDELPPGRQEIVTQVIASDSPRRQGLYDFIRERAGAGERAYVVCPLVEESDALRVGDATAGDRSVAAAVEVHRRLADEVFGDLGVVLVHGRLSAAERDAAMEAFREGSAQVLVATTVIEVGVDVPEATVMIIEDADRFGISQLHQLRGRVGRGSARSYCVLFSTRVGDEDGGAARLEALASTTDGFRLAEIDLEQRGEGSLFDTRQSGLPDLKLAKLIRDYDLVVASRADATRLVQADHDLTGHPALADEVRRRYGDERLAALETG